MIINRDIKSHLKTLSTQFRAIAVMGPRQSGKTTLVKETFPDYAYVSLENIDFRKIALEDPRGFLLAYSQAKGVIIDEIQEAPDLLSYMQEIIDQEYRPGYFIITGSQHFLMYEKITQSLAGRIALLTLLPLSIAELKKAEILPEPVEALLIKECYPEPYVHSIPITTWCTNYINTYIERDVRQILKITDVVTFQRFLALCAARVGNLLNYTELARDCDISPNTAKAWISILETSFIIKLLYPYYQKYNKRIIKSPKLYFYDTALVCSLLGIKTQEDLFLHPIKGALFECLIISELFKYNFNNNEKPQLFFWRDVQGHEIDCVIEKSFDHIVPLEIKSGKTITKDFFKGLIDWKDISDQKNIPSYVVYGGNETMKLASGTIVSWDNLSSLLNIIYTK